MTVEFVKTDFRKFELKYSEGFLSNIVFMKLTQLELLKIRKALVRVNNKTLALKITKLIELVDNEKNEETDFKRKIPCATNGERIREWEDIRRT